MRIFLDTEFMEDGETIIPLSIGLVRNDGVEYYAEFASIIQARPNDFVIENVIPNLKTWQSYDSNPRVGILSVSKGAKWKDEIKDELLEFCGNTPEFWGYYCTYDWVLICQIFGNMTDLPAKPPYNWPMYCLDLKQEMYRTNWKKEQIELKYPQPTTHFSLHDARWVRNALMYMEDLSHDSKAEISSQEIK